MVKQKQVLLYGNDEKLLRQVEKFMDPRKDVYLHVCHVSRIFDSMHHYSQVRYVIFVGICPETELQVALNFNAKILGIIIPENIDYPIYRSTLNRGDKSLVNLERELNDFLDDRFRDLKLVKQVG
jgi:hypothetical protein